MKSLATLLLWCGLVPLSVAAEIPEGSGEALVQASVEAAPAANSASIASPNSELALAPASIVPDTEALASLERREREAIERANESLTLGRLTASAADRQAQAASIQSFVVAAVALMALFGTILLMRSLRQTASLVNAAKQSALESREASRMAIEHFVSDRRPWISVEAKALSGLRWEPAGGRLTLCIVVRNLGQLPATQVSVDFEAVVETTLVDGDKMARLSRLMEEAKRKCDAVLAGAFILFPGQERDVPCELLIHLSDIADGSCDGDMFNPYLMGCVSYRYAGSEELHQTGFSYLPFKIGHDESTTSPLRVSDGDLATGLVGFAVDYEGGIAT